MDSREDNTTPHQPLLSSLVVRSTDNGGGGGGGASDYEPGEVRRDPPPYLRSDRHDIHALNISWCKNLGHKEGYRGRAGSVSPVRRRNEHHRFSPGFEPQGRGFGRGRDPSRHHHDYSPPYGRERFAGKGYDRPWLGRGPVRVEGLPRNNPNVQQREGDWICSDPSCKNLNFARRDHCNNCNRPRRPPSGGSPRRGYPTSHFPPRQRYPSPPLINSPGRLMNGSYNRSPPRIWSRDAPPRDLRSSGPLPPRRNNGRFPSSPVRGERPDYPHDESRDRFRHDRPVPLDWPHRDRGRESRVGYGRRVMSPPPAPELPPPRGWAPPIRERSRSPVRGGVRPRDYPRDPYMNRGRGERRVGRGAF